MANLNYTFKNSVVVVTGGAQGIGFEIAKSFLQAGAKVSLWDYSQSALDVAQSELSDYADQLHCQMVDVTDRSSCEAASKALPWKVNILVNNAGITKDRSFGKMEDNDFDAVINTNLTGLYNVSKRLLSKFDDASPKRIINMASVVALYGNFGQTNYVASKAGVIGMSKTWAKELGRKGFTINAIAPGFIRTKMTEAMPKEVLDDMAQKVPLLRLGETRDIANTCLFLASEEAGYINGTVVSVDGGIVI